MEKVKLKTYEEWLEIYKDKSKEEVIKRYSELLQAFSDACDDLQELQEQADDWHKRVLKYEDPEDMTLFYMWLDEEAKSKLLEWQRTKESIAEYIKKCLKADKLDLDAVLITIGSMLGLKEEDLIG